MHMLIARFVRCDNEACIGDLASSRLKRAEQMEFVAGDRKSTRLNSSHLVISYAVFCLKKKTHPLRLHRHWHSSSLEPLPLPLVRYCACSTRGRHRKHERCRDCGRRTKPYCRSKHDGAT